MIKFQVSILNDNVEGPQMAFGPELPKIPTVDGERGLTASWLNRTEVPKCLFINLNDEEQSTVTSWALVS